MNTNALKTPYEWPSVKISATAPVAKDWSAPLPLNRAVHFGPRVLLASVPTLGILLGSAWAIGDVGSTMVLQALIWATGYVFLALAIETRKTNFAGFMLTGVALPVLAVLSALVAAEFAVIGAALVAGWVAAAILKR